jgi:hypothetical protein
LFHNGSPGERGLKDLCGYKVAASDGAQSVPEIQVPTSSFTLSDDAPDFPNNLLLIFHVELKRLLEGRSPVLMVASAEPPMPVIPLERLLRSEPHHQSHQFHRLRIHFSFSLSGVQYAR